MIAFIDEHHAAYGVEPICRELRIAPSTYYEHRARRADPTKRPEREQRDEALRPKIQCVFDENMCVCGADKVWKQLCREDEAVARCTVERLMRGMGLRGAVRGRAYAVTTVADEAAPRPPDLVARNFTAKVVEKGQYGASFLAHLAVAKCADHIPIYRLEKAFHRQGVPIARSTMNELLHRASAIASPIWKRLLDVVRVRHVVCADETRLRLVRDKGGKTKNGFVWTFGARDEDGELDVANVFAEDRSGATPECLLEGTKGVLVVDGYSGYNVVDDVSSRRRAACHAHLRRYFHEALPTAPVAQEMLDLVAELYMAEHTADAQGLKANARLEFRKKGAGPIRARMRAWLDAHRERHPPKSPIGAAIRYAHNQWTELGVFLSDPRVPLDNNGSERALRRVALGRKNYLFVHDGKKGESIAGLYSLVATCEARGINPRTCSPASRISPRTQSMSFFPARGPPLAKITEREDVARHDGADRTVTLPDSPPASSRHTGSLDLEPAPRPAVTLVHDTSWLALVLGEVTDGGEGIATKTSLRTARFSFLGLPRRARKARSRDHAWRAA